MTFETPAERFNANDPNRAESYLPPLQSGSLAMLAAMRRASSLVSRAVIAKAQTLCCRSQYGRASESKLKIGFPDMERAVRATGLGESGVRRVVVIGGATAIVMIALLFAKPFYSAMTNPTAASSADVSRPVTNQEPATEKVSFVTSPTMETNPQFLFGSGDGSNGYYAERPEPTLALVRYKRMP